MPVYRSVVSAPQPAREAQAPPAAAPIQRSASRRPSRSRPIRFMFPPSSYLYHVRVGQASTPAAGLQTRQEVPVSKAIALNPPTCATIKPNDPPSRLRQRLREY